MTLLGKHTFGEIDGTRVTFVEKATSQERVDFLKVLLEINGYKTLIQENPPKKEENPTTYTIGVTDMSFNPTIAVYQRMLKTKEGVRVTPDYWNQVEVDNELRPDYYTRKPEIKTDISD
jgi:hypothetical protein